MRFRPDKTSVDPRKNLVGFLVGGVHYAIDIWHVREIVNPLPVTPLPHVRSSVVGVADHRGEVIPVVDLRIQFGKPREKTRRTKWILVSMEDRVVGVVVDAVTEVFGAVDAQLRAAPVLGGGEARRGILGVTSFHDAMVFVIDPGFVRDMVSSVIESNVLPSDDTNAALLGPR